jgi:hypothetical protein
VIDLSTKDSVGARRAVRLTFVINGLVGREDIVITAGSEAGAVALAGVALGMQLYWLELIERAEASENGQPDPGPISFYLRYIETGTATPKPLWERLRDDGLLDKLFPERDAEAAP